MSKENIDFFVIFKRLLKLIIKHYKNKFYSNNILTIAQINVIIIHKKKRTIRNIE